MWQLIGHYAFIKSTFLVQLWSTYKNKNTHIQDCHQEHLSFHLLLISPVFWPFKSPVSSSSANKLEWASLPLSLSPGFHSLPSRFIPILHWGAKTHRERADDQQSSGKRQQVTSRSPGVGSHETHRHKGPIVLQSSRFTSNRSVTATRLLSLLVHWARLGTD